jgi:hypothetical protein
MVGVQWGRARVREREREREHATKREGKRQRGLKSER